MAKRRQPPPVPPTLAKLAAVAQEHVEPGRVYSVTVHHDDGCPTLRTQRILDCTCDAWVEAPKRITLADADEQDTTP